MRTFNYQGIRKALLLTGTATSFLIAAPAYAQDSSQEDEDEQASPAPASSGQIVVTGSRIARPEYTNNSPTVTVDEEFLRQSSTSAIEESLNKLPQFVVAKSSTVSNANGVLAAAGGDIQPNATNTPGAANVSLRGVGANRSLVLIDGRRGPASNASGVVDVSIIPNAALQRVEIISGGASATYGADAVAGVTNFILKRDFQGLQLDMQLGLNQQGDGFEYQFGGIMGTDFPDGRGNVSIAMQLNTRERLLQRDLPWYRDLWNNPNTTSGAFFFVPRPGVSSLALQANQSTDAQGQLVPGCEQSAIGCVLSNMFPGANPTVPNNTGTVYLNQDGSIFTTGGTFSQRGGVAFWKPWPERDDNINAYWKTTAVGTLSAINALTPATVPTDRYNFLARGNYEINDWIGVFAQGMFSQSSTYTVQEPGPLTFGWDVLIPWGSGAYTGELPGFSVPIPGLGDVFNSPTYRNPSVPSSVIRNGENINNGIGFFVPYVDPTPGVLTDNPTNPGFTALYGGTNPLLACANNAIGGCTNTQVMQAVVPASIQALLNARTNPNAPFNLTGFLPLPRATYSNVQTYALTAGLEGSLPGTDWTWETFVNHSVSTTISRQTGMYSLERLRAVFTSPLMGRGFRDTGNDYAGLGGLAPGFGAGMASCTTGLNFFGGYEGVSQNCLEAITTDNSNRGTSRQTIVEANLQGGLFDLPAGQLRAAVGASYREARYELLNEGLSTAGRSFLDQIVGIYPSANMENNGYDTKELYGELLVPVLADLPFIQEFNLELGGRMSDYSTTGVSYTFKALGDWQVNNWLRFRGGFNRAERAPNISELLLTPQQTFAVEPVGDVCSTLHGNTESAGPQNSRGTAGSLDVIAICLELMARDNNGTYVPAVALNPDGTPMDNGSYYFSGTQATRQATGENGFAFPYAVGNQYYRENINPNQKALKPEVADTITFGAVIRSPFSSAWLSRLNLTVDYFKITINDPIGNVGSGGVLLRCVSPVFNPAAEGVAAGATNISQLNTPEIRARAQAAIQQGTCPSVFRNTTIQQANTTGNANTARIITTFDNDGLVKLSGIDATLSWGADLGPGSVFASLNGNYMLDFKVSGLEGAPLLDYVGTTGTGLKGLNFGSSFRYRIFGTIGYSWGPANASLQWQHTPATEDAGDVAFINGLRNSAGDLILKNNIRGTPTYNMFNFNTSYQVNETLNIRFGIDNVFGIKPKVIETFDDPNFVSPITGQPAVNPATGGLRGGSFSFFQDTLGRRFSFGASAKF